ncbi:MAG: class I SAM-dependent rRNA methyltransferase [Geminicoccaceae bacterium]|nr:class I SAM-dependent rRNA methyltransferase [Geminicoccaceae bacterium]
MQYPKIELLPGQDRRLRAGHPWAFSNEIRMDQAARDLAPGTPVRLTAEGGRPVALAHFNPHSLIAARVLTRNKDATIDAGFVDRRIERALRLRERLFQRPYYRLAHGEADGLPGLVIDRFDDVLVLQINTAGMAALEAGILESLTARFRPRAIVLRNDSPVRELEGLPLESRLALGALDAPVVVEEHGLTFEIDPLEGQKTGWYYDQRDNRAFVARLADGRRVLDLYSYGGGFGLAALSAGAERVLAIDRSKLGLELAERAAGRNGLEGQLQVRRQDTFAALDQLSSEKARFDLAVVDPPSFVKSKRELKPGLRGYRKLARQAAGVVAEEGVLAIASCSHNVGREAFADEVRKGLRDAGRSGRLIREAGAAPDHPLHPALPESGYLKFLVYVLD